MLWESDNALIHKSAFGLPLAILPVLCAVWCLDFYPAAPDAKNANAGFNSWTFQ
jgi:hypothetical protein